MSVKGTSYFPQLRKDETWDNNKIVKNHFGLILCLRFYVKLKEGKEQYRVKFKQIWIDLSLALGIGCHKYRHY